MGLIQGCNEGCLIGGGTSSGLMSWLRIGDRVTNIGERVIYAVTGRLEELNIEERPALE